MNGESFATLLKRHRIAAGLSQETLAELSGVSVNAISALERGARHAPLKATLDLLTGALALDDDARVEMEDVARLARARGPHASRHPVFRNLPVQLTSFVNRENVLADVEALLQSHRLVTLVGTGGAGKTRMAIKLGTEMYRAFPDGVCFVELAPVSDPGLVESAIARALNAQETPNRPILDVVVATLKRKRLLLILDNCEHVIEEARRTAVAVLQSSPNVVILATSRESFGISGEQVYHMPSLAVPSASELASADVISRYGAVQLFSDRAVSADNRFTLTVESAPHVAQIVRRLDGIPLAVELAAARVKVLSPKQLAQKLDERFRLLNLGDRSAQPRHRTMRALIDWSYDLLSPDERNLFRKLSIFAGAFTLELATTVCGNDNGDEVPVLDLLTSLVDKSLVQTEPSANAKAFRLLESIREYAREKLTESGDFDLIAREHARAFLSVAEQLSDDWETTPDRTWLSAAEPDLENFRAALSWTLSSKGDVLLGQRLTAETTPVWRFLFPMEGRRWARLARGYVNAETPPEVTAALDLTEAVLDMFLMQYKDSLALGERALSEYASLDDPLGNFRAKRLVGDALIRCGNVEQGEALLHESLVQARDLGARKSMSSVLMALGLIRGWANDVASARLLFSEALTVARGVGADRSAAIIALNLAEVEFMSNDAEAALHLASEGLRVLRALQDVRMSVNALRNEAAYLVSLRRFGEARVLAREAIADAVDREYSVDVAFGLQHVAAVGALRPETQIGNVEERRRAARVLGYADVRTTALGASREFTEQQEYDVMISKLRDSLGEEELATLMAEGAAWNEAQAVAEAMLI